MDLLRGLSRGKVKDNAPGIEIQDESKETELSNDKDLRKKLGSQDKKKPAQTDSSQF